ncbi:ferrous iron transport protein B [Caproiciproducens sp. CPB-2]|uniref:ferrous iron transport protein B n=1 Tax=Caproiciproducens sp. CPB-2 TaxID=3030017 RepID=UPI0023DC0E06|nr:ferrous iron transport protein B [Caproiciproducens sp. CPB-2]MDF1495495.1 ferrous iron transport protein B [Caproiciproducens sp. CPB-2]
MNDRKTTNHYVVALAGNPNCGKTTLFNALTGSTAYVGNWPGVTVEKKSGSARYGNDTLEIVDLPGIYSLVPYSPEEAIAGRFLERERPDLIIDIVDASNIERNLYLTTQLMELNIPLVIAMNMMDVVEKRGDSVDCALLSRLTGIAAVPISASKGEGLSGLLKAADSAAGRPAAYHSVPKPGQDCKDPDTALADARYRYIEAITRKAVKKHSASVKSVSEKIDWIATNRFLAIPVFFLLIFFVFYITFGSVGSYLVRGVEYFISSCLSPNADAALVSAGASSWLRSLVVDGILAGVGAVLEFLPQILLLFLLLSLLEDSGYMARAAFIMDAPMRRIGLSGRAFVPLLMGFGCTVPAVMGTRILESEKDKRLTILITPFMSCSAKTPIYSLFIAAFFVGSRPLAMFLIYSFGILVGLLSALLFKNSILKGAPAPFVMELPDYRLPTVRTVWLHVRRRAGDFLQRAGTTVFVATVAVWLLQSFTVGLRMTNDSSNSIIAAVGRAIAPVFTLCGFGDWKPAVALLTGLVAKESVVSTMSVLYPGGLTDALRANFTTLSACSYLIFVLLYTPCVAALSAVRREMGSLKWTAVTAIYQLVTAWYWSAMFYQCAVLIQNLFRK